MIEWAVVKAFLKGVPRQVWYAVAAVAVLWLAYDWAYDRGAATVQARWDAEKAEIARVAEAQRLKAEATEKREREGIAAVTTVLRKENVNARVDADRTIDGRRDGSIRLRDDRRCPRAVPQAAGTATRADPAPGAYLPREAEEALVRLAAEADVVVRERNACVAILQLERSP